MLATAGQAGRPAIFKLNAPYRARAVVFQFISYHQLAAAALRARESAAASRAIFHGRQLTLHTPIYFDAPSRHLRNTCLSSARRAGTVHVMFAVASTDAAQFPRTRRSISADALKAKREIIINLPTKFASIPHEKPAAITASFRHQRRRRSGICRDIGHSPHAHCF